MKEDVDVEGRHVLPQGVANMANWFYMGQTGAHTIIRKEPLGVRDKVGGKGFTKGNDSTTDLTMVINTRLIN